ncbi:CbiQ family ECF transporter T component [uncultured Jatrophihabitans sp.]|uniref:CbiQ family ECF transporter T component n=1 Tax=uncultured Jatrophihabitans sp. TaxID=1610747 RepID=UPI0035CB93C4
MTRSLARSPAGSRTPRALHPIAWWLWAIGMATAVSRTVNPLLLLLVLAVLGFVIANRRSDAPWARAFKYYLYLALIVIVTRVIFRSVFASGITPADHILFSLPHIHTPSWYAGIQLGGPVSLEATLSASLDGLRLGALLCCVGAANVLANPKRALRVLPGALYELGVAVIVALSFAPQLVESVQRVHRARQLRAGHGKGLRGLRSLVIPVLEDALERALHLAAGMDSRGYGRSGSATRASRRITAILLILGMCGLCVGAYGLLAGTDAKAVGIPGIAAGAVLCCLGLALGGRRVTRTSYRPDPWAWPEWVVSLGGLGCAVALYLSSSYDAAALAPSLYPLSWPPLPLVPTLAIVVAGLAALAAPPPVRRRATPATRPAVRTAPERERVTAS